MVTIAAAFDEVPEISNNLGHTTTTAYATTTTTTSTTKRWREQFACSVKGPRDLKFETLPICVFIPSDLVHQVLTVDPSNQGIFVGKWGRFSHPASIGTLLFVILVWSRNKMIIWLKDGMDGREVAVGCQGNLIMDAFSELNLSANGTWSAWRNCISLLRKNTKCQIKYIKAKQPSCCFCLCNYYYFYCFSHDNGP